MLNYLRRLNETFMPENLRFGPTVIVFGVNNFCNLHCIMCDVGTGNWETNFGGNLVGAKTKSMPLELFQHCADQIADTYPDARIAFAFTEPLAWKPLGEALAYAHERGIYASVTTNGLLLPRRAKELVDARIKELAVSLDGPGPIHDAIRRHNGSYASAIEGIKAVLAMADPPAVSVFCTITEKNIGALGEFLDGLRGLRLKRVGFIHNNFITAAQAEHHNLIFDGLFRTTASNVFLVDPTKIDIERLSVELTEIMATDYPFPVSVQPSLTAEEDLEIYYRQPEHFIGRRCNDAHRILMIDTDGEAIPAHGRCFRFPIANIRNTSLKEIWNHGNLAELRRTLHEAGGLLPACSRCCGGFGGFAG
ncbi:MAG TPA: radical SAM protein [Acidobacteriaceae bacterium]|jgi:MoaA/NifB/PqqE/SkfB family radical SAM enzyme|nr:radical SAM protein [Acidobacteriaceae bacterium]